jgi:photosystem II stability/assembly factor-like uncharacterized protein
MNLFFYFAALLVLLPTLAYSQQYRLEPLTSDLLCVATNGSRIATGGTNGIVMLSDDEGATWKQVYVPEENAVVKDISYSPNGSGLIVLTDSPLCYYTVNNGISWQKIPTPQGTRCITFIGDSALVCGNESGNLYKKNLRSLNWTENILSEEPIIDIAETGTDSIVVFTPRALFLVTNDCSVNQKLISAPSSLNGTAVPFHRTSDGHWGCANGRTLYYSTSDVSHWRTFEPDSVADVVVLQPGLRATALTRKKTYSSSSDGGRLYLSSTYEIEPQQLINTVNMDSVYSPRLTSIFYPQLPATVFTAIPIVTSVQLLGGGTAIAVGIDKMIYKQLSDGSWKQLCLLTDFPSRDIAKNVIPNTYNIMGNYYNKISYSTPNGLVFAQSSNNGVTWNTPQKDWTAFMSDGDNYYFQWLLTSCNSNSTSLILARNAVGSMFFRSTDTLQSFERLTSNRISTDWQINPVKASLQPFGDSTWFFTNSFRNQEIVKGWENNIRSVSGLSYTNGSTWNYTFYDSLLLGKATFLPDNSLLIPVKFPDSVYSDAMGFNVRKSGGCALWKSNDTLKTHEVILQPGIHSIGDITMFDQTHGIGFITYSLPNDKQNSAYAETFDGGKSWVFIDSSRHSHTDYPFTGFSRDRSVFMLSENYYSKNGVPNKIHLWKNNGKVHYTVTVPTDYSLCYPISADTLLYSVPGELYRLVLLPISGVEEPNIEDYESSVYMQPPYPNPASATVRIPVWHYSATVKREDITLKCYDISGNQIADLSHTLTPISDAVSVAEWDMSNLPVGVYIIKSLSKTG